MDSNALNTNVTENKSATVNDEETEVDFNNERMNISSFEYRNQLIIASQFVLNNLGRASVAIVLGSGLGGFSEKLHNVQEMSYKDIPFLPQPTIKGHCGKIFMGDVISEHNDQEKKRIMCFSGRLHSYEVKCTNE